MFVLSLFSFKIFLHEKERNFMGKKVCLFHPPFLFFLFFLFLSFFCLSFWFCFVQCVILPFSFFSLPSFFSSFFLFLFLITSIFLFFLSFLMFVFCFFLCFLFVGREWDEQADVASYWNKNRVGLWEDG